MFNFTGSLYCDSIDKYFMVWFQNSIMCNSQSQALEISITLASCASLIGCFAMMLSYMMFSRLRRTSGTLSLWVAISDFMHALAYFIPNCTVSAFVRTYSPLSSLIVTIIMTSNMKLMAASAAKGKMLVPSITRLEITFTWVLPGIVAVIPFFTDSYGKDADDAWFVTDLNYVLQHTYSDPQVLDSSRAFNCGRCPRIILFLYSPLGRHSVHVDIICRYCPVYCRRGESR